jgi:regulator of protease activity HflC (stomatin/prohibitin superfamily)
MIKKIFASIVLLASVALSGCSETVDASFVGVLEKHPFIGSGGVDQQVYKGGDRYYISPTSMMHIYDIKPIQKEEAFNDLATINSTPVDFKAIVRYELIPEQAYIYHEKFGNSMYENNLKKDFQNMLRDFARQHTVKELTTKQEVTDAGEDAVYKRMVDIVVAKGIPVRILAVTIGAIMPPDEVLAETARTEAQIQRALTEDSRADAEKKRKQAETNKADADNEYMTKMKMTPEQYLKGREIEIQKEIVEVVKKKDNVNMLVVVGGSLPQGVTVPQPVVQPKQ